MTLPQGKGLWEEDILNSFTGFNKSVFMVTQCLGAFHLVSRCLIKGICEYCLFGVFVGRRMVQGPLL